MNTEILLVEDNPNDVRLALHALKRHHPLIGLCVARDGQEALDVIFGEGSCAGRGLLRGLKLILLDLKLPKVDGLEVLARLKSDAGTKSIPVVVMTTSNEEKDLARAYALGANSYVVKPLDFADFTEVVRQLALYWLSVNQPRLH